AAEDGVDIISLSITPNRRPPGIATFFNPIDMALLSAVKAGIFVVQAAGNTGPSPKSICSFSPWIFTVGAASHDRIYSNSIVLGNNITIHGVGLAPGTQNDAMYTLVSAAHAVNDTMTSENIYASDCQDSSAFKRDVVRGNILICSYSIRFVLGLATIRQALGTAKDLDAAGVVFYMDPFLLGFQLNPIPMRIPGIVIPSPDDSKVSFLALYIEYFEQSLDFDKFLQIFLEYYNSSLVWDETTRKVVSFGGAACISGGIRANFSHSAPKIMFYSARGPDPEDASFVNADILKPNIVAPGNFIWAAWSSGGSDSVEFQGESFAMMSGTSMAAPHIAGLAALIKQKFPNISPAAIGSALSTTASLYDRNGGPIQAQRTYANPDMGLSTATPFDMGSGFVNATAALDPGLIFDTSYDEYMSFLCGINGSSPVVQNYTGEVCGSSPTLNSIDLNLPSITISKMNSSLVIRRTVINIGSNETYRVSWSEPNGTSIKLAPNQFFIPRGGKQVLSVFFQTTLDSNVASFGRISLVGSLGHSVSIPVSVLVKIYNTTG
ncbi:hypothetical protein M569_08487, partial [Genlisea aurea]